MANKNKQEQVIAKEPTELKPDSDTQPSNKASSSTLLNRLTILIALIALISTGYSYYINQHTRGYIEQENKQLLSQIHQLKQQQHNLTQEFNDKTTTLNQANQELDEKVKLFSNEVKIVNQRGNQNQDWLLLKARYYLELAQINAYWSHSYDPSTQALLQQADNILAQMNSAELFKVRQIIAQELLQLKSQNHLDLAGLLSQLDALQNNVAQLRTSILLNDSPKVNQESSLSNSTSWKKYFHRSLDVLSTLVVVRRNDEEIKPLLSPVYEALIKESIRLNLQEAQWALLNHNASAYQLALKQASATLKRGFNDRLANIATLIKQITELQKINMTEEKIEVGKALPLINKIIEQGQMLNSNKEATQGEQNHD